MPDTDEDNPSDTMRGRVEESRWKLWVLMNASRPLVAAGVAFAVFLVLVLASFLGLSPMRLVIRQYNALWWLFSPAINSVVTGVTLVVTFNQLVLSQELGPLGDQRERMQGSLAFRHDVEEWLEDETSPPDPASFLEALIDGIQTYANELEDAVERVGDEEQREQMQQYVDSLTSHATSAGEGLSDAQFGSFSVIYAALDFNYSWKIYEAERLQNRYADDFDDDTAEALDDVIQMLEFFGPAREHFKTLYFQWELVNLSRLMLYSAVPALAVTLVMLLYVSPGAISGFTLGVDNLVLVVSAATTVTLAPFFLLLSYVLRVATVAKRTLAIGPFVLRETDRSGDISWTE
ncbi:hypothetical protein ACFO0N_06325 [Halobium salinum]|uniref:Uncharacterized protein n=1 Tax=Halobium salinum TaxID=1364940 RepID=A0ABD5PA44_9EURY|nr:hypothetical protein [Halobium salinum]